MPKEHTMSAPLTFAAIHRLTVNVLPLLFLGISSVFAESKFSDLDGSLISILSCGQAESVQVAITLAESGNSVVHVIAGSWDEVKAIQQQISQAGLKGLVSVEKLSLKSLPYRDYLVNTLIIMDQVKAQAAGLTIEEARSKVAPYGKLVICDNGKISKVENIPVPKGMDVWTHRYYKANGTAHSQDTFFKTTLGYKWNAGLPLNYANPKRRGNRYAQTRAVLVDDGRIFNFSETVFENLGESVSSPFGMDQYLTCRDAFNGRFLWRKKVGNTYYGGLYIENMAPLVTTGRHVYFAGDNGKMHKVDTRSGKTISELPTTYIPGVISADDGVVVTATWKDGKIIGSYRDYDRRRMDWSIHIGTLEAYDDKTGKRLWKQNVLGTSMLIDNGSVFIVSRDKKDGLEFVKNRPPSEATIEKIKERLAKDKLSPEDMNAPTTYTRPPNWVSAYDVKTGALLWKTTIHQVPTFSGHSLRLESVADGILAVSRDRGREQFLSAESGKALGKQESIAARKKFFRYRKAICVPTLRVKDITLSNRHGRIKDSRFMGARATCLTGTVPAYGSGYIAQNICNCIKSQIDGFIAIAAIDKVLTPEEMEAPVEPETLSAYKEKKESASSALQWTSFRGNAERSSAIAYDLPSELKEVWSVKVTAESKSGTVKRDWLDYLNSRLSAAVISEKLAIAADIDQNELIAINLSDGTVAWRFMTAGRMNISPTIYEGICLAGDHAGYVYALALENGELLYRLRVAPEEKRMLSYGKVESVWPVVGGVLIHDGIAYASAGRSQGSDGGLLIRAFRPESGKLVWSKAIHENPRGVEKLDYRKDIQTMKRNDALMIENGQLRLADHFLDLKSGEYQEGVYQKLFNENLAAKLKEYGPDKQPKGMPLFRLKQQVTAAMPLKTMSIGNEAIYSWNWTHLGSTKFRGLTFGRIGGTAICWAPHGMASVQGGSRVSWKPTEKDKRVMGLPSQKHGQTTALILCNNAVVYGGSVIDQPEAKGFVRIFNLKENKLVFEKTYSAQLAFNGLAVDRGMIAATFNDGSMLLIK